MTTTGAELEPSSTVTHDWSVAAATVTGPSHLRDQRPGDDAFAFETEGPWLVAAVCDGAGSASHGGQGARLMSSAVVASVADALPAPRRSLRQVIVDAVRAGRAQLTDAATAADRRLDDYHTTLVGLVLRGRRGLFFHIGDGAAVAFRQRDGGTDWITSALSRPENGEYANLTVFATQEGWEETLRFCPVRHADQVALMTDGATPFALNRGQEEIDYRFAKPVLSFLLETSGPKAAKALHKLLDREDARNASPDDKTMLWARRLGA